MKNYLFFISLLLTLPLLAQPKAGSTAVFPPDGTGNVNTGVLQWSPVAGNPVYDLYWGAAPNPPRYRKNLTQTTEKPVLFELNQKYFWKVVAKFATGDSVVSKIFSFSTLPIQLNPALKYTAFVDSRDDKIYWSVTIGGRQWLAHNLDFDAPGQSGYAENSEKNKVYGRIYSGTILKDGGKSVAPAGWHIPSKAEWQKLLEAAGGIKIAGVALKEASDRYWRTSKSARTNQTGFSILPAGSRAPRGTYSNLGKYAFFWTTTPDAKIPGNFTKVDFGFMRENAIITTGGPDYGYSVRCVKD
jgi:uncharacterized protein (TIGR02145 family)